MLARTSKICSKCNEDKLVNEYYMKSKTQIRQECKKCFNSITNNKCTLANKLRKEILSLLGNCCCVCGYDKLSCLDIEHINEDGNIHRTNFPHRHLYLKNIKDTIDSGDYQLLCKNCHSIKNFSNTTFNEEYELRRFYDFVKSYLKASCKECNYNINSKILIMKNELTTLKIKNSSYQTLAKILLGDIFVEFLCPNCFYQSSREIKTI
jgi:hypothetical protein